MSGRDHAANRFFDETRGGGEAVTSGLHTSPHAVVNDDPARNPIWQQRCTAFAASRDASMVSGARTVAMQPT